VSPEPSERCTGVIARFGSVIFGLSAWMLGSFQLVMLL